MPITSLCMVQLQKRYRILYDYIFLTKWLGRKEKMHVELEDTVGINILGDKRTKYHSVFY